MGDGLGEPSRPGLWGGRKTTSHHRLKPTGPTQGLRNRYCKDGKVLELWLLWIPQPYPSPAPDSHTQTLGCQGTRFSGPPRVECICGISCMASELDIEELERWKDPLVFLEENCKYSRGRQSRNTVEGQRSPT